MATDDQIKQSLHADTRLQQEDSLVRGAIVPPLFQNSLFAFEDWDAIDQAFDDRVNNPIYTRGTNPTVRIAEEKIAALAGAEAARLFASGMGAITAAVLHFVNAGEHVVAVRNVYGPANNLLNSYLARKMGLRTTFISGNDVQEFVDAIEPDTRLIYLESPSSAVMGLQDLESVARLAKERGIGTMVDNTWASPMYQKPMDLGIDLEVHSASKYLAGHSDVIAGVVIGSEARLRAIATAEFEWLGATTAPFTAWLLLRSLRTLPMRMERHQANALQVARFLEADPRVRTVRYPGLPSHPQHALALKQMTGFSGLMSFELGTDDIERIKAFVNALTLFRIGVSWGGHESLVYVPAISYLKELPPERFRAMGISLGDIRISVGLEHAPDLIADLDQALRAVG